MSRRKAEAAEHDLAPDETIESPDLQTRPRGRPRLAIDTALVAEAVADLFAEGGVDEVTIVNVADKMNVSRATLYRTIPTKEDLLGILFERVNRELTEKALEIMASGLPVQERLHNLVGLQIDVAVRMKRYLPVFFGGAGLPPDVFERWRTWSRSYESEWTKCVEEAMDANVLDRANVVATTRLLLGMTIWVSRWYRPNEDISTDEIKEAAIRLLASSHSAPTKPRRKRTAS